MPNPPSTDPDRRYRLHQSLGYHLSIAARQQERRLDEDLKTVGLTRTTWCILLAIGNEELSQPSDIADFVGIDRTATSRALRQMEQKGWLKRSMGTEDKRTRQVVLTKSGAALIPRCTPFAQDNAAQLRAALSAGEEAELKRLLQKLRSSGTMPLPTL
jgi:DNA-binding MarR family transcriptional regulator